ncbi:MAG: hypothetical protein ACRC37_03025, partial [Lentisphaeria bacterium]
SFIKFFGELLSMLRQMKFTLIELLSTLVIVVILAVVAWPRHDGSARSTIAMQAVASMLYNDIRHTQMLALRSDIDEWSLEFSEEGYSLRNSIKVSPQILVLNRKYPANVSVGGAPQVLKFSSWGSPASDVNFLINAEESSASRRLKFLENGALQWD